MAYSKILQRIRSEKTNYRKRKIMLMGKCDFITVKTKDKDKTSEKKDKPAAKPTAKEGKK